MLDCSALDVDLPEVTTRITRFIRHQIKEAKVKGIVLGLSGGVDSSTIAALSSLAIGGEKVLGIMMPEEETLNQTDLMHAKLVAKKFQIRSQLCDITPTLNAVYQSIPIFDSSEKVSRGNIKARIRMVYQYYYANKLNLLVCGSSDKSETMMGYFTKWGDSAADMSPIMDLYKTQVKKLAHYLGVPEGIVTKPPTPSLWPNQSAEKELGIEYEKLDLILYCLERFMNSKQIAEQVGTQKRLVERIKARWISTEHKRRLLITTKLGYRTVAADFRLPRNYQGDH